ncbi:MAG TPA: hypothetical protein VM290_11775 [Gaiellaceae bacterium]|nr:hypothetical protein [Gaiellaceae bacterium]
MLKSLLAKKPLLSLTVGAVAFSAAVGFAATLGVSSGSLGAGNASVSSCDEAVTVAYSPAYNTTGTAGFKVASVTVNGIDGAACAGQTLRVEVVGAANASLANGNAPIVASDTSKTVTLGSSVLAADIQNVHAVISG